MPFDLIDAFCNNIGLWISEIGILLELVGAAVIVHAALKNRNTIEGLDQAFNYIDKLSDIRDAFRGQAIYEIRGFSLLGFGLALQFIGGLPIFPLVMTFTPTAQLPNFLA